MNRVQIRMLRALAHTVGRLSHGVRIACDRGVTSGTSLDYVYRNEPAGVGPLGRFFDRLYLANRVWKAVRVRRRQLERLLEWAIRRELDQRGEAFVLDVASGPGRYLLDVLGRFAAQPVEAICWDVDDRALDEGQTEVVDRGLSTVLFDSGDAFDPECYQRLPWRPGVAVAAGFYDWIDSDRRVRRSMQLIHQALRPGGCFLFTIQTGHRSLPLANALFPGHDGAVLRMKNRPASQARDWARQQGFTIARTAADRWGYYAVTAAVKS
jgi:SAM-dependent methyltransferase